MTVNSGNFRLELEAERQVLHVFGDIDLETGESFAAALGRLGADRPAVVDLAEVTFMDSSGLTVLVNAAVAGRGLTIRNASTIVRRVIEATGLAELLRVEP